MEASWRSFRAVVARLERELEQPTAAGWTAKAMLAHVAFWDETVEPVIVAMFRGERLPDDWAFGSGYTHPAGAWPRADEHNAREAAWAAGRPAAEVLDRLDCAHARAAEIVGSLDDDDLQDARYEEFVARKGAHYDEHRAELEALLGGPVDGPVGT